MDVEILTAVIAFSIALPLTALIRLPTKVGRKGESTPKIGGFSILAGFVAAPFIVALFSEEVRDFISEDRRQFLALACCAGLVCLMGARDDFRDVDWRLKMATHVFAALVLYFNGYHIDRMTLPGGETVALGPLDPVVTVFWVVLVTNALNLIDGRDGVAAGVAALVSATLAYVAWDLAHPLIAALFAALAGASLGFLPFNLNRARRYLGDSGAYLLGFCIAGLSIAATLDETGRVPLYIPLVALGLPILDTGVAYLRRFLDGRNPMHFDFDHFHDRLERNLRLSPMQVTLATYALTVAFCGAALLAHTWYKSVGSAVVGAGVLLFAVVLVLVLGYGQSMWNSARMLSWRGRSPAAEERS